MKDKSSRISKRKLIVDSTVLIHILPNEWPFSEKDEIIIPYQADRETKSFKSKTALELLKEEKNIRYTTPSRQSINQIKITAQKTGDLKALSNHDIEILALGLDYKGYIILSDDNAIQNVGKTLDLSIQPYFFRIKSQRQYFWKCTVCGEKYSVSVKNCIECGSPVKRYYLKKRR